MEQLRELMVGYREIFLSFSEYTAFFRRAVEACLRHG